MLKQQVVHFPLPALRTSRFGSFSRVLRMGMRIGQREVAKSETETITQLLLDLLDHRIKCTAVGAFIIPIFHERDGCVNRTLDVIAPADRQREFRLADAANFI
jgi:hypothetical protein